MIKNGIYYFEKAPYISAFGSCAGKKESEGPLGEAFDHVSQDDRFGCETWEQAERTMAQISMKTAISKTDPSEEAPGCIMGGDLLNQCVSTSFAAMPLKKRFFGLYGACSAMSEALILGSALISGGFERSVLCTASSHFCTAERQYRLPLDYGGQRPPTAQWTATASGSVILSHKRGFAKITRAVPGRIYDPGIDDPANMGAAMAQAAYETLREYFSACGESPSDYDMIVTGDLASVGSNILDELCESEGLSLCGRHRDCGLMLFDGCQNTDSGASGAGCSAAVLCAHILPGFQSGALKKILFCATGALLSPTTSGQGEAIPGVCHLVCMEAV